MLLMVKARRNAVRFMMVVCVALMGVASSSHFFADAVFASTKKNHVMQQKQPSITKLEQALSEIGSITRKKGVAEIVWMKDYLRLLVQWIDRKKRSEQEIQEKIAQDFRIGKNLVYLEFKQCSNGTKFDINKEPERLQKQINNIIIEQKNIEQKKNNLISKALVFVFNKIQASVGEKPKIVLKKYNAVCR